MRVKLWLGTKMKEEIRSGERIVVGLDPDGKQVDKTTASKQDMDWAKS